MPHVIIEYSDVLEAQISRKDLLNTAHQAVEHSGLFDAVNIRSRTLSFDNFHLGADKHSFLHVTIRLLTGRTDEQKNQLTVGVISALQRLSMTNVLISCECVEIHNESYQRIAL